MIDLNSNIKLINQSKTDETKRNYYSELPVERFTLRCLGLCCLTARGDFCDLSLSEIIQCA